MRSRTGISLGTNRYDEISFTFVSTWGVKRVYCTIQRSGGKGSPSRVRGESRAVHMSKRLSFFVSSS